MVTARRVLVLGARGTTGSAVVATLAARGCAVLAGVRDPSQAPELAGADPVAVDLDSRASMTAALRGVDALYALSPPSAAMVDQGCALHDVAENSGVRHVVRLSILGELIDGDVPLARLHDELDRDLRSRRFTSTVLRPSGFMQNFLGMATTVREGAFYLANGDGLAALIDVADIALCVASALERSVAGTYDLTGPETLTNADVARILGEELERPVRHVDVSVDAAREAMLGAGLDRWTVERILEIQQAVACGVGSGIAGGVRALAGREPGDFRSFVRRSRPAFL